MPGEEIDHAHVHLNQPLRQVGRGARRRRRRLLADRRTTSQRSSDSVCPLGPIVRYKVSMMLIWSRPNKRRRNAIRIRDRRRRAHSTDVTRVHSPSVNKHEDQHRHGVGRPHPLCRHPEPERIRVLAGLIDRTRAGAASSSVRKSRSAPAPTRRGCKGASARSDAGQTQQGGIGRGVPERVPVARRPTARRPQVSDDGVQCVLHSNTPNASFS